MKQKHLRRNAAFTVSVLCAGLLGASASHAGTILRLDTGWSELSHSQYDNAATTRLTAGYGVGPVSITASAYDFEEFQLKSNTDAHYELEGASVGAFWSTDVGPLDLSLGGGLFDWKSKTRLQGLTLGRDSGTSGMLEAGVRTSFTPFVSVYLNTRYTEDVSGEDLTSLSGGVQFSF